MNDPDKQVTKELKKNSTTHIRLLDNLVDTLLKKEKSQVLANMTFTLYADNTDEEIKII